MENDTGILKINYEGRLGIFINLKRLELYSANQNYQIVLC